MEKEEVIKMFSIINSFWPKCGFDISNTIMLDMWTKKLAGCEWKIMNIVLAKMADNEKFAPSLATIKEYYANVLQENLVDSEVGWGQVKKAINNFGYMRAEEAIKSLPEEVGKAVIAMGGWQAVCEAPSESENSTRAQFRECLKAVNRRKSEERRTDTNITAMIHSIQAQNKPQIEEKSTCGELQVKERSMNTSDFESVEEVIRNLGLRKEATT